jgi:vacuolar-type H+-ATPase subunit D/Vma8
MGKVMQVASFSYAEVKYSTGDISYQVRESVKIAQVRVKAKQENVSGVQLPAFDMSIDGQSGMLKQSRTFAILPDSNNDLFLFAFGSIRIDWFG